MGHHVTSVPGACPGCGSSCELVYTAVSNGPRVRFACSIRCEACGFAQEADGDCLTTDARRAFCEAEGRWSVSVRDLGSDRLRALQALRTVRDETPSALMELIRARTPIVEGALVEVEGVRGLLERAGIVVALERLDRAALTTDD